MLGDLWQDVKFAVRTLLKRPGFASVAVLTIALGIGANTAIFSVANGVLLRPLPLHEPERLVLPDVISPKGYEISLAIPNFKDWRGRNRTFESFGAHMRTSPTLTGGDRPEIVVARRILGDYFETLNVRPALGRLIASDETWAGAAPIAVVTHGFWERHLDADPAAVGRTITLDDEPFEVVGVLPRGFRFPSADTEVYLPMGYFSERLCWDDRDCSQGTWAFGRLKDGVTLGRAQTDLDRITREIAEEEGEDVAVARLAWLTDAYVGDIRGRIWILMGAVGFVLLIACANVAGLLLSRGEGRRREIALRAALGAGRGRVIGQFLTESLVLALAGGALGVALGYAGVRLLVPAIADDLPSILVGRIGMDPTVLIFTLVVTLLAGLLFGVAPALRASRLDLAGELKEGGRAGSGRSRQRLRAGMVVAEVAFSLMLLIGAGLMIQSLRQLQQVDKGFEARNVLTAAVSLPRVRYDGRDAAWPLYRELLNHVQALPDVRSASLTQIVPLSGRSWERGVIPEGAAPEPENFRSMLYYMVTPDHFETFGIPILRGRTFSEADREGAPLVCIIDERMAETFWPGEDPIGRRVSFETEVQDPHAEDAPRVYRTVVGVARNVRHYTLESPSRIQLYVPFEQTGTSWSTSMTIAARTRGDPRALTEQVRRELAALDPNVPLDRVQTMEGYVDRALSPTRVVGGLLTVFSLLALLLSAVGLFGVMSFSVVQRLREIGIRMALGARAGDVVRMISRQGLLLTLTGIGLGLAGAIGLTRLMTGVLYEVEPVDPVTYGTVAVFLITTALVATYLPARRATRVDPATVLREE